MKQTAYSDSFKVFLGLVGLLVLANLLLVNDYTAIWNGSETNILLSVQKATANNPVAWITEMVYEISGLQLFWLRLPGVITLLGAMAGFYYFGKRIFGRDTVIITMLITASSFVVVNIAKFISGDVYLLLAQLMHIVFTILFIKQPLAKWRWATYVFLFFGLMVHPIAMSAWALVSGLLLWIRHPKAAQVKSLLFPGGLLLIILALVANYYYGKWQFSEFVFSFGQVNPGRTIGYILVGMLPWLGFLPAAFLDLWKKFRSREEMAIIIFAWLVASLASMSLSLAVVLAFMVGKQVWFVLQPGYPYLRLVKGFAILNLVTTFFLVLILLLGGLSWFGGGGYRSVLAFGFVFWMFSFLGLLGLFLKDRRVVIGGFVFSGVVASLTFWGNVYPRFDHQRQLPRQLVEKAATKIVSGVEQLTVLDADWAQETAFAVYANKHFTKWNIVKDTIEFERQLQQPLHQIFLIDKISYPSLDSSFIKRAEVVELKGGWGRRGTVVYVLGK